MIPKKPPVPAKAAPNDVYDGVAAVLFKAGGAISPNTKSTQKVLTVLKQIEGLLPFETGLVPAWIAVRALNLPASSQVGAAPEFFEIPIYIALLSAAQIIATTDTESTVRGHLGSLGDRPAETLVSTSRIVDVTRKPP